MIQSTPFKLALLTGLLTLTSYATAATSAQADALTPAQQAQVRSIVQEYLSDSQHLVQLVGNINKAMTDKQFEGMKKAVSANAKSLFYSPNSVIAGDPNGKITLVEYYDYLCPYCKMAAPSVDKMIADNKDLRVVYKQFPLPGHGEAAVFAAKAALASTQQNKFLPFHQALMAHKGELTDATILDIAKSVGIDVTQLQTAMKSDAVINQLKADMNLGAAIQLPGTPLIIVANAAPGKASQDQPTINKLIIVSDPSPQGLQTAIDGVKN